MFRLDRLVVKDTFYSRHSSRQILQHIKERAMLLGEWTSSTSVSSSSGISANAAESLDSETGAASGCSELAAPFLWSETAAFFWRRKNCRLQKRTWRSCAFGWNNFGQNWQAILFSEESSLDNKRTKLACIQTCTFDHFIRITHLMETAPRRPLWSRSDPIHFGPSQVLPPPK